MPDEAPADDSRIETVIIDPRWRIVTIQLDGATHIVLSLRHPAHGDINALLPRSQAMLIRDTLIRVTAA